MRLPEMKIARCAPSAKTLAAAVPALRGAVPGRTWSRVCYGPIGWKTQLTSPYMLRGWITSYGPAFETLRTDTLKRIRSVIIHQGFRGSLTKEVLIGWCQAAWQNWTRAYRPALLA
jgi:hypothetical protein